MFGLDIFITVNRLPGSSEATEAVVKPIVSIVNRVESATAPIHGTKDVEVYYKESMQYPRTENVSLF